LPYSRRPSRGYGLCRLWQGLDGKNDLDAKARYELLAIRDIQDAADFAEAGYYESSKKRDRLISLEVSPYLARETQATLAEARRLLEIGEPPQRYDQGSGDGGRASGNRTAHQRRYEHQQSRLLFAQELYERVGGSLHQWASRTCASGGDVSRVASVASFSSAVSIAAIDGQFERQTEDRFRSSAAGVAKGLLGKVPLPMAS